MITGPLIFSVEQFEAMVSHVLVDPTRERCGLLTGRDNHVEQVNRQGVAGNRMNKSASSRMITSRPILASFAKKHKQGD